MIGVPVKPIRARWEAPSSNSRAGRSYAIGALHQQARAIESSLVEHWELISNNRCGRGIALRVLLNLGEHDARPLFRKQSFYLLDALANPHALARQGQRVGELLLKVLAVRNRDHLEPPKLRAGPHLANQEDHREALPGSLRVPDDAAAPVVLAILKSCLAVE